MDLKGELEKSLSDQAAAFENRITLSPTENFPLKRHIFPSHIDKLVNLYVFEAAKSIESKRIFSGREQARQDLHKIYRAWMRLFGAQAVSMTPLSGLHAHLILALALRPFGKRILLLPEEAGGHTHSEHIFQSLGYEVVRTPVDYDGLDIDFPGTKRIIDSGAVDFFFVDRSEGLNYTDFSPLLAGRKVYSIFDASHFLANILVGDYANPFSMGFDLCVATLHKSLPGPQKAAVWTKSVDDQWKAIADALATYISSLHIASIYAAGLVISDIGFLEKYSRLVMANATALEAELQQCGVPVVRRRPDLPPAYYIFVTINDRDRAYQFYTDLAAAGIDTNYRFLPYRLGYGVRLGTAPVTMFGMQPEDAPELARMIADVYHCGVGSTDKSARVRDFLRRIKERRLDREGV